MMTTHARKTRTQQGMTLVEVLISTTLLVGGGGSLLVGMYYNWLHVDYLRQQQIALNAAQSKLDRIVATIPFSTLADPNGGWLNKTRCASMGEDDNCNGVLDPGEDVDNDGKLTPSVLTNGKLAIQVKRLSQSIEQNPATPPTALRVHIAARWTFRGRCIGGEDRNCNGVLDPGEDTNGNGWIDAPVMVSTVVTQRDDN